METETHTEQLAAFDAAQAALAATPTEQLLRTAYALTHTLHRLEQLPRNAEGKREHLRDTRQQRDMVTAEVLRRTDGSAVRAVR